MARFKLRIIITGICSLVTDKPLKDSTRLSLVLLDAWDVKKSSGYKGLDDKGEELPRHGAMLQIPARNIDGLLDEGGSLIWYPRRHQLAFKFTEEQATNKHYVDPSMLERVANMTDIAPNFSGVGLDVLSLAPPKEVVANVVFNKGGKLSVEDGELNWKFSDALGASRVIEVYKMAYKIYLDYEKLTEVKIMATPFTNGHTPRPGNPGDEGKVAEFKIIGRDLDEEVVMTIANACDNNPLNWRADDAKPTEEDRDFKWHYDIIYAKKQMVKDRLGANELPFPKILGFLGNGRNCFPAFWVE